MSATEFRVIIIVLFTASLASCKKSTFEHAEELHYTPCTYCEIVDSIEGSYVGHLYEFTPGAISPLDTIVDTLITLEVIRNYDYSGHIIDSTVCQFDLTHFFNNPIRLFNNSGGFSATGNDSYFNTRRFVFDEANNEFVLELQKTVTFVGPGSYTVTQPTLTFRGVRQ